MQQPRQMYTVAMADSHFSGAGGSEGGMGMFLFGVGMAIAGGYLLTNQVTVTTGFWHWGGYNTFGLTLIPLLIGIGLLFFDGRSIAGWFLLCAGALIILVGIIANMDVYFRPTSLFNTVLMLALLAGGLGLIARAVRSAAP